VETGRGRTVDRVAGVGLVDPDHSHPLGVAHGRETYRWAVRVVAGTARGRRLVAPPGLDTRPTSDRVREAVFNALQSLGAIEGANVLDLFAGSGALGIEALSRGAAHATFVDTDRDAVASVRVNLTSTGMADRATLVHRDAMAFLAASRERFDLALCDPPYVFSSWPDLLDVLPARTVVVESDRSIDLGPRWEMAREKRYGTTVVEIAHHRQE
jgi:16S rRNA (guanine966-N2)-methyltransferase